MGTEQNETAANAQVQTLESDVKNFADNLPYWARYLAQKLLTANIVIDEDIDIAYGYLAEYLKLVEATVRPDLVIASGGAKATAYHAELKLAKIINVEGVNALLENQSIEFSKNLTLVYGANGSGKSGYVRLLKDVFYSKAKEAILPNIHIETGHKPVNAKFTFSVAGVAKNIDYGNKAQSEFQQFSVFDGKSVISHLENKNEFEFRPAGLSFFGDYTSAIARLESKLNEAIANKQTDNQFGLWFDGVSEIKEFVEKLSFATKAEDIQKYVPFSEEDTTQKQGLQKEYDELLLASQNKEKEIKHLENVKKLLLENKTAIERINVLFIEETLQKVTDLITDYNTKATLAKAEGIENFKSDKVEEIGSEEWKRFIVAARHFALKQHLEEEHLYPHADDNCLLCQQPLSDEAAKLVNNYWDFIKSVAEENANKALASVNKAKNAYNNVNFDLFPDENTLTNYFTEKHAEALTVVKDKLAAQNKLALAIIGDIDAKTANVRLPIGIDISVYTTIETAIDAAIKLLKEDEQAKKLEQLKKDKTFLEHKEKYNLHLTKIEAYVNDQVWIKKAQKANYAKRQITDTEKNLSGKYFNQKYVDTFNEECQKLNGSFGIEISHSGAAGRSYRQLRLKGRNPNAILSEGEQKVIAIADFLAEMTLSEVNKGIIFDDPVTSLDNDRKKQIAERLADHAKEKQVIIFTHDLVFFYHMKNCSKKSLAGVADSFLHHSIEKEQQMCGKIVANSSPANEGDYNKPTKAEEWLRKSKATNGSERTDFSKSGLSALRSSYEALAIFTVLGGTVQRFDPQIRMGRLKDIKYDKTLVDEVVEKHGEISDLIEGHLPSDEFGIVPTPEILEEQINAFKVLKEKIKAT